MIIAGLLALSIVDILDQIILHREAILCVGRMVSYILGLLDVSSAPMHSHDN